MLFQISQIDLIFVQKKKITINLRGKPCLDRPTKLQSAIYLTQSQNKEPTKMNYTILWRLEENGDFFEQDATNKKSISYAVKDWRKFWGIHENDCVAFEVKLVKPS